MSIVVAKRDSRSGFRTMGRYVLLFVVVIGAKSQIDPGVRGGAPGSGRELSGLGNKQVQEFDQGLDAFQEVASVSGTISNTEAGLGPRFNLDNCAGCHAQPAVGGSSPKLNPQVQVATKQGARNAVPPYIITADGPVREVRFKFDDPPKNTVRSGGVQALFTITGRTDAPLDCNIAQPDFGKAFAQNNLIFRIPTPVYGGGLIEAITDKAIMDNKSADAATTAPVGISGH